MRVVSKKCRIIGKWVETKDMKIKAWDCMQQKKITITSVTVANFMENLLCAVHN